VAILTTEHNLVVRKAEGKLANLIAALGDQAPIGHLGIGHTRWATHGVPNEINAHPHTDCTGRIAVVHNGIIENYASLRDELQQRGHTFTSQTDTEVIVHLVEEAYRDGGDFPAAMRQALQKVRGAYAIAMFCIDEPEYLVGARSFSPLVVGLGEGQNYLASDIPALLPHTRQVLLLEDGEVVTLDREGATVTTLDGAVVARQPFAVDWDAQAAERGGYPHFVLKEIHEQPEALRNALRGRLEGEQAYLPELDGLDLDRVQRICIIACGTSYYASLVGKQLIEPWAKLPVEVAIASEYRYAQPVLGGDTLAVFITQSGETADTLASFRLAREQGTQTLALTNVVGSSITRGADAVLYLQVGPEIGVVATKSFTAQLALLTLVGLHLARHRGTLDRHTIAEVVRGLRALPQQVESILQREGEIATVAQRYADRRSFFFFGRGFGYPVALEGALKLKEISYIHAEGYPAGELKHGPIAMLDPTIPVMAVATVGATYEKLISNIQEVRARQAEVLAVATEGDEEIRRHVEHAFYVPRTFESLTPTLAIVPLQLFAYHVAVARGCDVDQPRNLAKSVTVE
jgi:glucosamine--fructose-6-phosphate aminotransferase (isomerizing)